MNSYSECKRLRWPTWRVTDNRNSYNVDTSERLCSRRYVRHVLDAAVVQSTVVRVRKWAVRVH